MENRRIDDWCTLWGANVEIRQLGSVVCSGIVDDVTGDGRILWIRSPVDGRRLFEKADFYQAWAIDERIGFHYQQCKETILTAEKGTAQFTGRVA